MATFKSRGPMDWSTVALTASNSNLPKRGQTGLTDKSWLFRENIKNKNLIALEQMRLSFQEGKEARATVLRNRLKREDEIDANNRAYANQVQTRLQGELNDYKKFYQTGDGFRISPSDFYALRDKATVRWRNKTFPSTYTKKGRSDPLARGGHVPSGAWSWKSSGEDFYAIKGEVESKIQMDKQAFMMVTKAQILTGKRKINLADHPDLVAAGIQFEKTKDGTQVKIPEALEQSANMYQQVINKVGRSPKNIRSWYSEIVRANIKNIEKGQQRNNTPTKLNEQVASKLIKKELKKGFVSRADFRVLPTIKDSKGAVANFNQAQLAMQENIFRTARSISQEPKNKQYGTLGRPQLAALLAAAYAESSFDPTAEGDSKFSKGLFQINTDPTVGHKLSPEEIANLFDPETNIRLILERINEGGALRNKKFMSAKTVKEASNALVKYTIRPKDPKGEKQKRYASYAQQFFKNFGIAKAPVEDNKTDDQVIAKRAIKFMQDTNKIEDVENFLKGNIVSEFKDLIGDSEDKANDSNMNMAKRVVEAAQISPQYTTILNSKGSIWEKAKGVLEKRRARIQRDKNTLAAAEAKKHRLEMEAKGYVYIDIESMPELKPINLNMTQVNKDIKVGESRTTDGGKIQDIKLTGPQQGIMKVRAWEGYLRRAEDQYKGAAAKIMQHPKYSALIRQAIRSAVGPNVAFYRRTTANPRPERHPILFKGGFGSELVEAYNARKKLLDNNQEIVFEKKQVKEKNSLGDTVYVDTYTPKGSVTKNEDNDHLISTQPTHPNEDNIQEAEGNSLFFNSSVVQKLSTNSKILLGNKTKELIRNGTGVDPNIELAAIKKKVQELVNKVVSAGDDPKRPLVVRQFFLDLLKDPEFKDKAILFGSDLIDAIAYNTYNDLVEGSKDDVHQVPDATGVAPILGKRIKEEAKLLPQDVYAKLPIMKEALRSESFLNGAEGLAIRMLQDFGTGGAKLIDQGVLDKSLMSHTVLSIYNNFAQKLRRTTEGKVLATQILDAARSIASSNSSSQEQKEDANTVIRALRSMGSERLSDIGAGVDSFFSKLGSLQTTAKSLANMGDTFSKVLNEFLGSEREELDELEREKWDFIPNENDNQRDAKTQETLGNVPDRTIYANQDMQSFEGYLKGRSKNSLKEELRGFRTQAEEKMQAVLKSKTATKRQKELAVLTAKRTFNAIALTYQFAGMLQGGSGGRAISNEDFENLYKALWAGGGFLQASNIEHALGVISDVRQRFKILKSVSHRGEKIANAVMDRVRQIQTGRRLFLDLQSMERQAKVYGTDISALREKPISPYENYPEAKIKRSASNKSTYTHTMLETFFPHVAEAVMQTGSNSWINRKPNRIIALMEKQAPNEYLNRTSFVLTGGGADSEEYVGDNPTQRFTAYVEMLKNSPDPRDQKYSGLFGLKITENGLGTSSDVMDKNLHEFLFTKFNYGLRKMDKFKVKDLSLGARMDERVKRYIKSPEFKAIKKRWQASNDDRMQRFVREFYTSVEKPVAEDNITLQTLSLLSELMPDARLYISNMYREQLLKFGARYISEQN
mgnify:FL=1